MTGLHVFDYGTIDPDLAGWVRTCRPMGWQEHPSRIFEESTVTHWRVAIEHSGVEARHFVYVPDNEVFMVTRALVLDVLGEAAALRWDEKLAEAMFRDLPVCD
jgi:hypothetical protein